MDDLDELHLINALAAWWPATGGRDQADVAHDRLAIGGQRRRTTKKRGVPRPSGRGVTARVEAGLGLDVLAQNRDRRAAN
jgi:hypothetical protein